MIPNRSTIYERGLVRKAQKGDGICLNLGATGLATVGAGVLLAGLLSSGLIMRTGSVAAFVDTTDTGANLDLINADLGVSDTFDICYSNNVGFAATIAAGVGITLVTAAANNIVPANSTAWLHFEKTGAGTYSLYVLN